MTRCDYDGVLYRVFCVTLLATAFTFTVILTNVFIDIDGLLASKEKGDKDHDVPPPEDVNNNEISPQVPQSEENKVVYQIQEKPDTAEYREVKNYEEDVDDPAYRTKRSLDSTNFQFHLKDPKMKNILTNRLATLLEELDAEESNNKIEKVTEKDDTLSKKNNGIVKKIDEDTDNGNSITDNLNDRFGDKTEKDLLHLTMHNILLQGIIGHMDFNDVYKKVHSLVHNIDTDGRKNADNGRKEHDVHVKVNPEQRSTMSHAVDKHAGNKVENQFMEEIVKCTELHKQINEHGRQKNVVDRRSLTKKGPKVLIKTVIDITSLHDKIKDNDTNSKEVKGVIKLIYNGKSVKFKQIDEKDDINNKKPEAEIPETATEETVISNSNIDAKEVAEYLKEGLETAQIPTSIINNAIAEYFSKNAKIAEQLYRDNIEKRMVKNKRLKRHVKVRDEHHYTTHKSKSKKNPEKKDDDELYVQIETHFDSKGIKGEKKRKLVRKIIDKIEKAIHTDIETLQDIKNKSNHFYIRKRMQDPLKSKEEDVLVNKILIPLDTVVHRELSPISKTYPADQNGQNLVSDKSGETWKHTFLEPHFLSGSKAINSAEMGEVDVNYARELKTNDIISQRIQTPLNIEPNSSLDSSTFFELGNLKFYVKDLQGTGFSIGFNQFVAEPPDDDSINTFTGVDRLLNTYQKKYDEDASEMSELGDEKTEILEDKDQDRQINNVESKVKYTRHNIVRRSTENGDDDYHSNEYKIIFNNDFLPYDSYQEVIEDRNKKVSLSIQKETVHHNNTESPDNEYVAKRKIPKLIKVSQLPTFIGQTIIDKQLKPSEIFGLATLLGRVKRSIKVKKYSKINMKSKLNRYINTKMAPNKIYLKNKRSKRQIDKIRIIASDNLPNIHRQSGENIYLVSDENIYTDRALVSNVEIPEQDQNKPDILYDYIAPLPPYLYEEPKEQTYGSSSFGGRSRHNALMSKYPHIFMDEISRSKEENGDENAFIVNKYSMEAEPSKVEPQKNLIKNYNIYQSSEVAPPMLGDNDHNVQDMVDAILPLSPRSNGNYKLTVKILPKNITGGMNAGFKEIHTSINKSISKNGLIISSQVNVSEVSKVEKINHPNTSTTDLPIPTISPLVKHIKSQQEKMKYLLKQHKQRIEEQLIHLNKKKMNLDKYIVAKGENADPIDVILPLDPPQILHLTKEEAGQLISSALMKLRDTPNVNDARQPPTNSQKPSTWSTLHHVIATTTATTPKPHTTTTIDPDKAKIINTILHNENLTNTILTKIDTNTVLLQKFLQKLTDKLETPNTKTPEDIHRRTKTSADLDQNWKDHYIHKPFFSQTMPNIEGDKNDTHLSIPFVYAYQQPFPLSNNTPNAPVASVVYQGHIHTNALRKNYNAFFNRDNEVKSKPKVEVNNVKIGLNDTRFFIDDLENDFKRPPVKREDTINKLKKAYLHSIYNKTR